jgi:hypothetical protein
MSPHIDKNTEKDLISAAVVSFHARRVVESSSPASARFRCGYSLVDWLINSKISSLIKREKIAYGL